MRIIHRSLRAFPAARCRTVAAPPSCRSSTRTCTTATTRGTTCRRRTRSPSCARPASSARSSRAPATTARSGSSRRRRISCVPSLRPYRTRGDVSTWVRDETVVAFLEDRLARQPLRRDRRVPPLRRRRRPAGAAAHGGARQAARARAARALRRRRDRAPVPPGSRTRASSGRTPASSAPRPCARCCAKHRNLWCDLAFRSEQGGGGKVPAEWRAAVHRVSRPVHGRHRHVHAGALALHRRARELVARVARRPAAAAGRAHRVAQRRRAVRGMDSRAQPMNARPRRGLRPACVPVRSCAGGRRRLRRSAAGRDAHDRRQELHGGVQDRARPHRGRRALRASISPCARAPRPRRPRSVRVDATMPEHRHGMNYRPVVTARARRRLSRRRACCSTCPAAGTSPSTSTARRPHRAAHRHAATRVTRTARCAGSPSRSAR